MAYTKKLQSKVLEKKELEERYEGYKEKIKNYTIMDRNTLKKKEYEEEMCKDMEEIYGEGRSAGFEEGEQAGIEKTKKEMVLSLAEMGLPIEQIAKAAKYTVEVVQSWIEESMTVDK